MIKTEHAGAKKGRGAFWGHKKDAKNISKTARRVNDKCLVREATKNFESYAIDDIKWGLDTVSKSF